MLYFDLTKIPSIFVFILRLNCEAQNAILPHHMSKLFLCSVFKLSLEIVYHHFFQGASSLILD